MIDVGVKESEREAGRKTDADYLISILRDPIKVI